MAAFSVVGVASAQVTLTGVVQGGLVTWQNKDGAKGRTAGLSDAAVKMAVSEDLGGGLKASGFVSLEQMWEDGTGNGNGAALTLSGGFGSFTISGVAGSDFLPVDGLTSYSDGSDQNRVSYMTPNIGGLVASVTAAGRDGVIKAGGAGTTQSNATSTSFGVGYGAGPFSLEAGLTDFSQDSSLNRITGVKASYDMGVAKFTVGTTKADLLTGADVTEMGYSVSAPLGALAVTANYATSKAVGSATRNGYSIAAAYALSKRTSIDVYVESYDNSTPGGVAVQEKKLLLTHKF